jgi:hypothetical protein
MMRDDEENPFRIEDLAVPESADTNATPPKSGQKAARKKGEPFIQITATQANKLAGATGLVFIVFFHLMFQSFKSYHKPFSLPADALDEFNISRRAQLRALEDLAERGLVRVGRGGPRKPPDIAIVGLTKGG